MGKRTRAHAVFNEPCEFGDPRVVLAERYKSNATWVLLTTRDRLEMTKKSLLAIRRNSPADTRIMVFDSGSIDGSVDWLLQQFHEGNIDRLQLARPGTVPQWQKSYAVIQAVRALEVETYGFFCWVDNDVVVREHWLGVARQILQQRKDIPVINAYKTLAAHDSVKVWPYVEKCTVKIGGKPVEVELFIKRWPPGGECWVVRRKFFDTYGLPPVRQHDITGRNLWFYEDNFYITGKPGKEGVVQIDFADSMAPRGSLDSRKDGWTGMK